ncbi:MAG: hypothetical protein ACRDK7_08585 [Solirubrobacteraceae bacterium]
MHERLEERARTPRYTIPQAAEIVGRPANTVRRWSLGHRRKYQGRPAVDDPLIAVDGDPAGLPLSFLNLLELQLLSRYRNEAALQAIRRALEFVAKELEIPRPLISIEFKVRGGELFTQFSETEDGRELLVNASRGGQVTLENLVGGVALTDDIDYDEDIASRWWFKTRSVPLLVDTRVAAGHPITAETGVRLDAIASRHRDGYSAREIQDDTGATETEVVAAILAA